MAGGGRPCRNPAVDSKSNSRFESVEGSAGFFLPMDLEETVRSFGLNVMAVRYGLFPKAVFLQRAVDFQRFPF